MSELTIGVEHLRITADVGYGNKENINNDEWKKRAAPWTVTLKRGRKQLSVPYYNGSSITEDPTAADVIYSLLVDSTAIDETFENWCANFGYEPDSRKAEKIYNQCVKLGKKLVSFLGEENIKKLRNLEHQ